MKLLTQNSKMKKSSINGYSIFNFGITAVKSCPMADKCKAGCYATQGTFNFNCVKNAYEKRLQISKSDKFVHLMQKEMNKLKKRKTKLLIRIHDSGDFYNKEYLSKWLFIIDQNPDIKFYSYTKSLHLFKNVIKRLNFKVIASLGGKLDSMIDINKHTHARVFESLRELQNAGYVNGTENDLLAATGKQIRLGLVYHGNKSFSKTNFNKGEKI